MADASDKEYKESKLIKQGKREIKSEFKTLQKWINDSYDLNVLNIIYDFIHNKQPRIMVCIESSNEMAKIENNYCKNGAIQKAITTKFQAIVENEKLKRKAGFFDFFKSGKFITENLFVCFSDFQSIAMMESNESITTTEIKELESKINDRNLWYISNRFDSSIFFLHSEDQVNDYLSNGKREEWATQYFKILKKHDEFNYYKKENFSIELDSKENFDTNFDSNWYYYYK